MISISTHILDTSTGKPAQGVTVILEEKVSDEWKQIGNGITENNGRISNFTLAENKLGQGIYRLIFETESYFKNQNVKAFYPEVIVEFEITDDNHYHVPLLLNPYGYSTYRGS